MTPEQIKTLIDQKIAGQGSMVDVGGALPTILKEIVDMAGQGGGGGSDVKPIIITDEPSAEMTTAIQLAAIGITPSEIAAAAEGKRTGVIMHTSGERVAFQPITNASSFPEDENYSISFYNQEFNASGEPTYCFGYKIDINGTSATVTRTEL